MPAGDTAGALALLAVARVKPACGGGDALPNMRGAKLGASTDADPPALPLSQPAFAAVPDLPMSRLRVRCRRARSSLTPRTIFVTKRARRVRTHARARARHALDSSNHRPLSPPPFQVRHSPPSRTAPAPSLPPRAPALRRPCLRSLALQHTPAPAPRRAGPRLRGCAPRSGATGRLARPQRPSPATFLGRKRN